MQLLSTVIKPGAKKPGAKKLCQSWQSRLVFAVKKETPTVVTPFASPLCGLQGGAREARDDRYCGEKKKFLGGLFDGPPQFLKPQILAETLRYLKKTETKFDNDWDEIGGVIALRYLCFKIL